MGRHRWPTQPPPTTGGRRVHGPTVLADLHCVRLQLSEIIAYPTGMQIRLALTAGWPQIGLEPVTTIAEVRELAG